MSEINSTARKPPRRIFAVLPIPCGPDWGYWYRDMGLIVRTLRELGYEDAWLVLYRHKADIPNPPQPIIVATNEELEDPAWWKAQAPEGVIMNFWGASRYEGIREAARQATPRLVEKLDTAGIFSPGIMFRRYLYEGYFIARDAGLPPVAAVLKSVVSNCVFWMLPGLLDKKRVACLARMPVVAAESPVAVERTKLYLRTFGGRETKVVCIPHPVDDKGLGPAPSLAKENKIVSVGRWDSFQKNFPLLLEVLGSFLAAHPGWSADIIGKLPADANARLGRLPGDAAARIKLTGPVAREQLGGHYHASKIFLMSSRHESFNIAAAEALCCGCSVAGPAAIASVRFFTSRNSGTAAERYSAQGLLDALRAEEQAWAGGRRDPAAIAADWVKIAGAEAVTRKLVEALQ